MLPFIRPIDHGGFSPSTAIHRVKKMTTQRKEERQDGMLNRVPLSEEAQQNLFKRVKFIDVLRGLLMCLIVVGHGLIVLDDSKGSLWFKAGMIRLVNLGTPGFTAVSGMLFGFFEATRADMKAIRRKYFKRGIQLLVAAHFLIAFAVYYPLRKGESFLGAYLSYWYITDTLAVLFIVFPPLIKDIPPFYRLAAGIFLLAVWRWIHFTSWPDSTVLSVSKDFLFGVNDEGRHLLADAYPIVPLLGLFLIGTTLGGHFALALKAGALERFLARIRRLILSLAALSAGLVGIWAFNKLNVGGLGNAYLKMIFFPDKLYSLLPLYLALFLSLALFFIRRIEIRKNFKRPEQILSLFGRTSLFTYVMQYFLVQTFPHFAGWQGALNIPQTLLFITISMTLLFVLSYYYDGFLKSKNRRNRRVSPGQNPAAPVKTAPRVDVTA